MGKLGKGLINSQIEANYEEAVNSEPEMIRLKDIEVEEKIAKPLPLSITQKELGMQEIIAALLTVNAFFNNKEVIYNKLKLSEENIISILSDIENSSEDTQAEYDFVSELRKLTKEKSEYKKLMEAQKIISNNIHIIQKIIDDLKSLL